jgi:hypothetical protein
MINHFRLGSIIDLKSDSQTVLQHFREITARFPELEGDGLDMLSTSLLRADNRPRQPPLRRSAPKRK